MDDVGRWDEAKYSYEVHKWFGDQPGHPWDDVFVGYIIILLEYGAFLENQLFRRKHARHQLVCKSEMGVLNPGTVR